MGGGRGRIYIWKLRLTVRVVWNVRDRSEHGQINPSRFMGFLARRSAIVVKKKKKGKKKRKTLTNEGRFNDTRESLTCPPPLCTGTKGVMPCLAPSKSQFFVPCHFRLPEDRVVHQPVALRPPSFWFVDSSPSNRPLFESNSFELVRGSFWKFEIERLWDGKGWKESMNGETTLIARVR